MNDPSELQNGLEIFEDVVIQLLRRWKNSAHPHVDPRSRLVIIITWQIITCFSPERKRGDIKQRLRDAFSEFIAFDDSFMKVIDQLGCNDWEIYLASFSEKADELRQWIPYAQNAKGVALGFDAGFDSATSSQKLGDAYLLPCCYKSKQIKSAFVEQTLDDFIEWYEKEVMLKYTNDELNSFVITEFVHLLIADLAACKTSEYEDEKEWRLFKFENVSTSTKQHVYPDYYVSNNILKPYYACQLTSDSFNQILLGPLANELNIESFSRLAKQHKIECKIEQSSLPYRG